MRSSFGKGLLASRVSCAISAVAAVFLGACGSADAADSSDGISAAGASALSPSDGEKNLFSAPQPWTKDVSSAEKSDASDAIIGWLSNHGGFGTHHLDIDFSLAVLHTNEEVPFQQFSPTEDFYHPDCDEIPFPVPRGGALEGENGYRCTEDGDCHLLVVNEPTRELFEMWRADLSDGTFRGGCAVRWDLDKAYGNAGRGRNCTSADAGGFPISAMVFSADEVASGSIDHALRFILPNNRIRKGFFVAPATHTSTATTGGPDAPPYGVRLRLKKDFPLDTLPSDGARVVARALIQYGMILADGGQVPLTATDDRFTRHKWTEVGVEASSLAGIAVTDLEVVDMEEPIPAEDECVRTP